MFVLCAPPQRWVEVPVSGAVMKVVEYDLFGIITILAIKCQGLEAT